MIKAVFIDIDGTLLDFEACVEESMRVGLTENGIEYKPEMLETFHRINNGLWRDLEQGKLTFERLLEIRWATIFEALGIDLNGPEFEKYFRARLHKSAIPMAGSYEMLEYLSGKYRLFAASNGPHEQQVERLRKADMLKYFEEVFTSGKIGAEKPSADFFTYCFEKAEEMIGRVLTVMIEGKVADEDVYVARTYRDAPNVDGYLFLNTTAALMTGDIVKVMVTDFNEYDLIGEMYHEED